MHRTMTFPEHHSSPCSALDKERLVCLSNFAPLLGFHEGSSSATVTSPIVPSSNPHVAPTATARELIADKVNKGNLGAGGYPTTQKSLGSEMGKYLYLDNADALGGSIIKVPAMELESPDDSDQMDTANLMPSIGNSHTERINTKQPPDSDTTRKPHMAASLLNMVSKAERSKEDTANGSAQSNNLPDTNRLHPIEQNDVLQDPTKRSAEFYATTSTKNCTDLETAAAVNMGRPLSFTRSSAQHAPSALIRSLFNSFSSLVESRVKTWTLLLLRHSLSSGDKTSRNRLMSLLSTHHAFEMNAMITEFQVKDILPEIKSALFQQGRDNNERRRQAQLQGTSEFGMEHCDLVIPIQFKASIDVTLQNHQVTVHLTAPATVGAIFADNSPLIQYADISVNTDMLVSSMVEQARLVVFQAVSRTTSSTEKVIECLNPHQIYSLSLGSMENTTKESLTSGGRSRYLLQENTTPPIDEDEASRHLNMNDNGHALKLSGSSTFTSLLKRPGSFHQRPRNLAQARNKSVQWDTNFTKKAMDFSGLKRGRISTLSSGPVLKRSTKSFGKAHAEIFESSRNASFAEFGNIAQNPLLKKSGSYSSGSSAYHVSTHILQRTKSSGSVGNASRSQTNNMFEINRMRPTFAGSDGADPSLGNKGVVDKKRSFQELSRSAVYSVTPPNASSSILGLRGTTNGEFRRTPTLLETMLLSSTQTKCDTFSNNKDVWKGNATF